jgi:predicted transcriptional regulator
MKLVARCWDAIQEIFSLTFYDTRRIVTAYGGCRKSDEGERMAREVPTLGELEIRVLRLVWEHQPCTERQISDLIQADREVARTTVLKTMQRLEGKKFLVRVPGEGPVKFRAALDQKRVLPALVRRFVDTILGGSADPLVAYLADAGRLSAGDLESLRNIARKIERDGESSSRKGAKAQRN